MQTLLESRKREIATYRPTRYYLIGVEVGSQGDRVMSRIGQGLCGGQIDGLSDLETVEAPNQSYAVMKLAYVCGLVEKLYQQVHAALNQQKSA